MKKIILALCILGFCIPVFATIKEHTVFEKSIGILRSIRSSAVNAESNLKSNQNASVSLVSSYGSILKDADNTNMQNINVKLNVTLIALNDLISTIDTLCPEIK